NRQKYGFTEGDDTTGLDNTLWRKYEGFSGRWNTPDVYTGSIRTSNPQTFNRYSYVQNDPLNFVDPSGLDCTIVYMITTTTLPNGKKIVTEQPIWGTLHCSSDTFGGPTTLVEGESTYDPRTNGISKTNRVRRNASEADLKRQKEEKDAKEKAKDD